MRKVNHPEHYNLPGKKECIEQMLDDYGATITINFCLGNCYKYLYRAGEKTNVSKEEDLKKAKWYFDYVTDKLYIYMLNTKQYELYEWIKENLRAVKYSG